MATKQWLPGYENDIWIENGTMYQNVPAWGKTDLGPPPEGIGDDDEHFVFMRPLWWVKMACKVAPYGGALAACLWLQKGLQGSTTIRLTRWMREDFGLNRDTSRRLLLAFEEAGLIAVDRTVGHSPIVTILLKKPKGESEG